jgi:uncharacterized repeat protein (TIGR03847 family)
MDIQYDLDPVDELHTLAIGEPGQREFFLQARQGKAVVTLGVEKFQMAALAHRIFELLGETIYVAENHPQPNNIGYDSTITAEWKVGEIGIAYSETKNKYVIIAKELVTEDESPRIARFWLSRSEALEFAKQTTSVVLAGRPICKFCGLPIDKEGHPCPMQNGQRPIM